MNASTDNRYEQYVIKENSWNLTPNGSSQLSRYIILDHAIQAIKMLYGRPENESSSVLYLPRNWAMDNMELIKSFLQVEKLLPNHKAEIGMTVDTYAFANEEIIDDVAEINNVIDEYVAEMNNNEHEQEDIPEQKDIPGQEEKKD